MASFVKFENFMEDLCTKVHNLHSDELDVYLTNTAPNVATHEVKADLAEISTGNGYAGPQDIQNALSRSGGTTSITGVDVVITASGGTVGPFRYVVLDNNTPTSPADPLIGYWDYASSITLQAGETFTVDFGSSVLQFS